MLGATIQCANAGGQTQSINAAMNIAPKKVRDQRKKA